MLIMNLFFSFFCFCLSFFAIQEVVANPIPVAIIGGGPAGLTAGLYCARSGVESIIFEGDQPGGQLVYSSGVENYPGFFPAAPGADLIELMRKQTLEAGVKIQSHLVKSINFKKQPFTIELDDGSYIQAHSVILALGSKSKELGLPSEKRFFGKGVSSCALCDGLFYKNEEVVIVGGGDAAFDEALLLSKIAKKVTLIHRSSNLRANYSIREMVKKQSNVDIILDTVAEEILGSEETGVIGISCLSKGQKITIPCKGIFIAIGQMPAGEWLESGIKKDKNGYILVDPGTSKTSILGVFAAGDICDPRYRQAITAAASGCRAALEACEFVNHMGKEAEK